MIAEIFENLPTYEGMGKSKPREMLRADVPGDRQRGAVLFEKQIRSGAKTKETDRRFLLSDLRVSSLDD